ncbi:MAG: low molecular weight protein-tyrosine-phosphatase [Acidimicrobiales bacterium]
MNDTLSSSGVAASCASARTRSWDNVGVRLAMVCLGNICRSPMAAAVAAAMIEQAGLSDDVTVESFGTAGYHAGEGIDPRAEAALLRGGWPSGGHRARRLGRDDIAAMDLVLCADRDNLADVRRLAVCESDLGKIALLRSYDPDSFPGDDEVPDPWGSDDAEFDQVLALIEQACRGLVGQLARAPR